MKMIRFILTTLTTLMVLLCLFPSAFAETADEWTVLIYMCGSDLESEYSYASGNLEEIASVNVPVNIIPDLIDDYSGQTGISFQEPGGVNVLIETGGAKKWHAQELGMDIRTDALQIWRYDPAMPSEKGSSLHALENGMGSFVLEEERPLTSMADPDTLSHFIRWGAQKYPAEKFALVLWNHGGGSATGIFIDELFNGEYMTLDLLNQALEDGGVHMEAVLFDACLMANLETASAIREHANWMIASEELVAGMGTAIGEWLQELYYVPVADGRLLGRWICDTTMIKYANTDNEQARDLLTWSVIDLSKIELLENYFDRFFEYMGVFYTKYPSLLVYFATNAHFSEIYGTGTEDMYDLSGILYLPLMRDSADVERQMLMQSAVADAVDYCVRGAGRPAARGISFCLPSDFDSDKLDVYAHNCPSPHYLAILDAISPWKAPDWVYEHVERYPEMKDQSVYNITLEKKIWEDGSPAFSVAEGEMNMSTALCEVYKMDELTGQIIQIGILPAYYDTEADIYRIQELNTWQAIDEVLCEMDLHRMKGEYNLLFNIPVMVDSEIMYMRCGHLPERGDYRVYGLWEGYDDHTSRFIRNVKSLSQVAGQDYCLLYKVYNEQPTDKPSYVFSPTMTIYRSITVDTIPLPKGTYYLKYILKDSFLRTVELEMVELSWDGETFAVTGDPWEGSVTLSAVK